MGNKEQEKRGDFIYSLGENNVHVTHEWTLFTFFKLKIWKSFLYQSIDLSQEVKYYIAGV